MKYVKFMLITESEFQFILLHQRKSVSIFVLKWDRSIDWIIFQKRLTIIKQLIKDFAATYYLKTNNIKLYYYYSHHHIFN